MAKKIKIGVVIVHFVKSQDTLECIQSLDKIIVKNISLCLYLVDNDPHNRISKRNLHNKLKTEIIISKTNRGYGAGANQAIKKALKAGCLFILLINNDTVVKKEL